MAGPKGGNVCRHLGFESRLDRQLWIKEHEVEITDYARRYNVFRASKHFHIGPMTVNKLLDGSWHTSKEHLKAEAQPPKNNVTPKELAAALIDRMIELKSENFVLSQTVANLKGELEYLKTQCKIREEEDNKQFSDKLEKVLIVHGE